ncbi:MAG: hypothetical protein US62_C0050G0004 [Candidatus Woesebacteria bacterium GW2011_GWA1_37_8]|uniref:Transglutaminase-like domain-containing protein n=2 Tax=Candidatus Woeseibacteriota TaxID=1752722 RepID=A0A0G0PDI8_9BACT|nr:MAG: hypothetical protein US39_C0014G0019 [Microgenomates group bacterium GW2011_GWC1_37_12b]KKQ43349.1 MAG: hypothetical protein US62_C0050G0004 [Candidatus Woesebacteria bacterium GW2011_GWA1_37_8]KKQ87351.1 MAG: hypothetical protein UT10_C0007G0009 [Candidatus Woesebacteria bacterium GW2011_GWB1_38_8b]
MSLKKIIKFALISFLLLLIFPKNIIAKDDFKTTLVAKYEVSTQASANVTFDYTIENLKSEILAKEFHVNFTYLKPKNLSVTQNGKELKFNLTEEQNSYYVKIIFEDDLYGQGKTRNFQINFTEENIAKKTGNILEISIPKLNSIDIDVFENHLIIPSSTGPLAYVTPSKYERNENGENIEFVFKGQNSFDSGIKAAFGEFQVFEFNLNYNLKNESTKSQNLDIAVPPDTPYQNVYLTKLSTDPVKSRKDEDGNWLLSFKLKPLEQKTVVVSGFVQLFSDPRSLTLPTPQSILNNLGDTRFWQTDDKAITDLANELKTVDEIYKYVVKTLKYDFNRVNPQSERFGSVKALQQYNSALCTEFTDLFIAITRAAGIPVREIQGYAYTENDKLQPLSLVSDVLHAWPEYWDNDRRTWVAVDPTWESTTGFDYFNKFDLNHFAFVIHGVNDSEPLPAGSYKFSSVPKKDVFVSYGKLPDSIAPNIETKAEIKKSYNPLRKTLLVTLINKGYSAEYNIDLHVKSNDKNPNDNVFLPSLIPYEIFEMQVKLNYGLLAKNIPDKVLILSSDRAIEVDTGKEVAIINQIAILLVLIFIIVSIFFTLHRKFHR